MVTSRQRRGAEVFGEQLTDGLTTRGWDVDFRALVDAPGPTVRAPALVAKQKEDLGAFDRDVVGAIRDRVDAHRPHLIFANGSATLRYSVAARFGRRRPKLVYGSIGEPTWWSASKVTKLRTRFLLSRTDLVTSVSTATRQQLIDGLGVSPDKVAVAPIGVPTSFAEITPEPRTDRLRLLFLGSLSAEKAPDVALRAVAAVSRDHPITMRIVGGGPLRELLEHQVEEQGLTGSVDVVGPVADVSDHLAWADVLLLTSKTEGLPGVILEAGAAGVPAVAFDVGGVSDIVVDGKTGRLVPRGDDELLVAALGDLAANPLLLDPMSEAVRDRVMSGFTVRDAFDRYDEIFRAVVAGRTSEEE